MQIWNCISLQRCSLADGLVKYKNSPYFHYDFRVDGQRHTGTTGCETKTLARAWLRTFRERLEQAARDAKIGIVADPVMTCLELLEKWLSVQPKDGPHRERVKRDWDHHILPAIGEMNPLEVTQFHALQIRLKYMEGKSLRNAHYKEKPGKPRPQKDRSPNSGNKLMTHLCLVFSWAVDAEILPRRFNPPEKLIEQDPVKFYLTQEQVDPFLAEVDRPQRYFKEPKLHRIVAIRAMLYLALREDEARHLRWDGFNADLSVYQALDTKTGKNVPLAVPQDLRIHLNKLPRTSEWVIPAEDGEPHRQQFTTKTIIRAGKAVGLHLTPHRMRGTCVTIMARNGVSAFTIQRVGRWARIETALKYVEVTEEDIQEAQWKAFPGK